MTNILIGIHTDKLCSSLKSTSYLLKNLVKYCDIETLKTIYHSYFESKIKYGILSCGVTKKQNITSIFKCQKRILRMINKAQYLDSCRVIFKKLGLLTVPGLIIKEACLQVKENLHYLNDRERVCNTRKKETRIAKNDDFESNLNFCIHIYCITNCQKTWKMGRTVKSLKGGLHSTCVVDAFPQLMNFSEQWPEAQVRNVC